MPYYYFADFVNEVIGGKTTLYGKEPAHDHGAGSKFGQHGRELVCSKYGWDITTTEEKNYMSHQSGPPMNPGGTIAAKEITWDGSRWKWT